MVSRRVLITGSLGAVAVGGSMSRPPVAAAQVTEGCGPAPAPVPSGPDGWLGILAAHRNTVSLRIDDGRRILVDHRSGAGQSAASTIKVFHLAAYASAVTHGTLHPQQTVTMRQWERWYYPADGGAHVAAMRRLGIPYLGSKTVARAADPHRRVRLDDVVSAMIRESDNAAADLVRELVGPGALHRVIRAMGATRTHTGSLLGSLLQAQHPGLSGDDPERLADRYLHDLRFRYRLWLPNRTSYADQARYFTTGGPRTSAADLTRAYRRVVAGTAPGAQIMRRQLEWQKPAPDGARTGFKAGSVPGVLGIGLEQHGPGTTPGATAALLVSGLDQATATSSDFGWQLLLLKAIADPAYARRVACALR